MNNEDILHPTSDPESPPITPCCNYIALTDYPVMWNPFNKVVVCHNCGHIYVPKDDFDEPLPERTCTDGEVCESCQ